jgi:predicted Zn finger-like uncharacterized protein
MRLTCPNCGAQYEVPDDVIPFAGRDVQCSNCGNTWFQAHSDNPDPEPQEPPPAPPPRARKPRREPPPPPAAAEAEPDDGQMPRRPLSGDVADVLREEAQHEASLRAREQNTLESQPDLGLDDHTNDADRRAAQARARMARIKGEEGKGSAAPGPADDVDAAISATISAAAVDTAPGSHRDLLPDIDDISSTLRSSRDTTPTISDEARMDTLPRRRRRSGFARGFSVSILIFAAFFALYLFAPQLARAVPTLDPVLNAYIATVDQGRLWLDTQIAAFMP